MPDLYICCKNENKTSLANGSDLNIIQSLEGMNINDENQNFDIYKTNKFSSKFETSFVECLPETAPILEKGNQLLNDANANIVTVAKKTSHRRISSNFTNLVVFDRNITCKNKNSSEKENIPPKKISLRGLNLKRSNSKFFVIKSDNFNDIEISYYLNTWSTTFTTSEKLSKAHNKGQNRVILFFSLNLSGKFYGAAELKSDVFEEQKDSNGWQSSQQHRKKFKIEWLIYKPIANRVLRHVVVSSSNSKPVTSLKNGTEIFSFDKAIEVLDIMFRYVDF